MSEKAMISIIIPVYNTEKFLKRCLDSIIQQNYETFEVILINDGSNDKSGVICDLYAQKDERFKVIHTQNQGVSKARNTGLKYVSGKYIIFVDSDDYILADMLENYLDIMQKNDADVIIGGINVCEDNRRYSIKSFDECEILDSKIWNRICTEPEIYGYVSGKMFKTNLILDNEIRFNPNMYSQEDLDFNLSVYEKCDKFEMIDYAGYAYEYTPGKRKPPIWDFIANSLKMYQIAQAKIELSIEAEEAIKDRIVNQIFSFLYNCCDKEEYQFAIEKLRNVENLKLYLKKQKISGERKYIIKWYLDEKFERIYIYFLIRKTIKRILGKPISE